MNKKIKKIFQIFNSFENFLLITHLNPDVDGISSMLALHILLKSLNKNSFPLVEEIPENTEFLPYSKELILVDNFKLRLDKPVTIVLDAHSPKRIYDKILEKVSLSEIFIIIDHHQLDSDRKTFSKKEIILIDPLSASTSILVYKLLKKLNFLITPEIAQNLLAGIYFDTGCFKYENVNSKIFLIASELSKLGANPSLIASSLFENMSLKEVEALKIALSNLNFLKNGSIAISYLSYEDIEKIGVKNLGDIANFLRSIKGVKVSALIKEVEKNVVSVSLRSRSPFEVLEVAKKFNGGGHKYACGFKREVNNFYEFINSLKKELEKFV